MRKVYRGLILGMMAVLSLTTGCETDIDIIAPERDVTVIYGLLEVNKQRQYIRINRGFIGESSAQNLASQPGINEYDDNELSAAVIEISPGGNETNRWELIPTYITNKDTGAFASDSNKVYYFDGNLDINSTYRIECIIDVEGEDRKFVTAETGVIGSVNEVTLLQPRRAVNNNEERQEIDFIAQGRYRNEATVQWARVVGGVAYTAYYRFYYWEVDKATGVSTRDSLTFDVGVRRLSGSDINSEGVISFVMNPEEFFSRIDRPFEDYDFQNAEFERYASDTLQYFLEVADNTLATYITVNQPATEVLQERPEYTNVNNGIGIFASRLIVSTKSSNPQRDGRVMDSRTISELILSDQVVPLEDSYLTSEKGFQSSRCQEDNNGIVQCR